jgi:ADP-ribosylglycohydrolase
MVESSIERRAIACIQAVAVGDAMGKMTEGYSPDEVLSNYGGYVQGFRKPIQPKSKFDWGYAEVTDDTRFTLFIAESIIAKGCVNQQDIIQRILKTRIKGWPGRDDFCGAASQDFSRTRMRKLQVST